MSRSPPDSPSRDVQRHAAILRITHWLLALAILVMIGSGWRIYNASPIFPLSFPNAVVLGGNAARSLVHHNDTGVANGIAWHLAGIWLLGASFVLYIAYGVLTGHFRRDFLPVYPRDVVRDFVAALKLRLNHRLGRYNAVQKASYWGAMLAITMMVLSGLAIWKPVQLHYLTTLFGGFQGARIVHFLVMSSIVAFLVVHVALVAIVPKTLVAMILGRASAPVPEPEPEPAE